MTCWLSVPLFQSFMCLASWSMNSLPIFLYWSRIVFSHQKSGYLIIHVDFQKSWLLPTWSLPIDPRQSIAEYPELTNYSKKELGTSEMGSHQLFHHIVSLAVPQRLKVEGDLKPSFSGLLKLAFQNFDYFLHLRFLLAAESFLSH